METKETQSPQATDSLYVLLKETNLIQFESDFRAQNIDVQFLMDIYKTPGGQDRMDNILLQVGLKDSDAKTLKDAITARISPVQNQSILMKQMLKTTTGTSLSPSSKVIITDISNPVAAAFHSIGETFSMLYVATKDI